MSATLVLATLLTAGASALPLTPPSWSRPTEPFRVAGDTWYVGTEGVTVLLVRGPQGAVLFDSGIGAALPALQRNLATLGVAPDDIELILTSHAHVDHTGALGALKAWSGARVLASADSAALLAAGGHGDLHFGDTLTYPPVSVDDTLADGESVRAAGREFVLHLTAGHTPGSSTWSWRETTASGALDMVYADSLTAPGYRLLDHPKLPGLVETFRASFERIAALPCDVLVTPHPEASRLFERRDARQDADAPLRDAQGCRGYAERARTAFEREVERQRAAASP